MGHKENIANGMRTFILPFPSTPFNYLNTHSPPSPFIEYINWKLFVTVWEEYHLYHCSYLNKWNERGCFILEDVLLFFDVIELYYY